MTVTDGTIKIYLSTNSPYPVGYTWTVIQTGTVSGAVVGSGNIIEQTVTGTGTVTYIVTATETDTGCSGESVEIPITVTPIPKLEFKSNTTQYGGNLITTTSPACSPPDYAASFGNDGVIVNEGIDVSLRGVCAQTATPMFTITKSGNYTLLIDGNGSATVNMSNTSVNPQVYVNFYVNIAGTVIPISTNSATGTCTGNVLLPNHGSSSGFTCYYLNTNLDLLLGDTINIYFTGKPTNGPYPRNGEVYIQQNNFKIELKEN